ncbi:MAG: hypothetical protein EOP24_27650 [Hyphomicrobiales bacterium]|nr:MAG: hypothetical protein EOP24_27650 [Hyphomicrobiales bacterium]
MAKWAFQIDPVTKNIGLYDEPTPAVTESDYANPSAPCNAPLNNPEANLPYVYWHILMDNLEVAFDQTVSISHSAIGTGVDVFDPSAAVQNVYDVDPTIIDHDALTHSLGVEPLALVALGDDILTPGYPVQYPVTTNGSVRYVCPFVTSSKVYLREFRSRGSAGLSAVSLNYRILVFRQQRPAAGNVPPKLVDFDPATGLLTLGDGRWRNDRRYLQVVSGGTPFGLALGRTMDAANGAPRIVAPDGTVFDPVPSSVCQRFTNGNPPWGAPMTYDGTFTGGGAVQVQAP